MHLYLHDYTFVDQVTDTLTGSMSLTSATFSSVLIAIQLKSQMQVFAQVIIPFDASFDCNASIAFNASFAFTASLAFKASLELNGSL